MTFNNKQELIDKIKEKKDSAKIAYEQTFNMQPCYETKEKQVKNKAYMEAYEDVIALIDSAKIVVYPEETGEAPITRNDELDALQYAVEGLNKNRNLVKAYFGATIKVHTKKRIVGSTTPFESMGKIVSDSGKYISIKQEDGGNVIIDKENIESIETIKEHEESKTLLEPLCNKWGKTKEECPFHRMGSAYEDCSGFEERKPEQEKKVEITQKQAKFIAVICKTLKTETPKIGTKSEAQQWISNHIDEYNEVKNGREFDERESEFEMYGGCDDLCY